VQNQDHKLISELLFVGPNDLAFSVLGYTPARFDEPEFLEAIQKVVDAARKHNKLVGILVNDGDAAARELKRFDVVAMAGDVKGMLAFFKAEVGKAFG
jgi:4-hydroxy-2-oxoheptanedioate aldolase